MKKNGYLVIVVVIALLFGGALSVLADGHGGGHGGGHGHFSYGGSIWLGPGWGWGWGPWWGPSYYPYYPNYPNYPYNYGEPPVVMEQQPQAYEEPAPQRQQAEDQYYWYFCPSAKNYYPYVKKCPKGWLKVVPPPAPADNKE